MESLASEVLLIQLWKDLVSVEKPNDVTLRAAKLLCDKLFEDLALVTENLWVLELKKDRILKQMRSVQHGDETESNGEVQLRGDAVLHNLQLRSRTAEWIEVDSELMGLAHMAKTIIRKLQDVRFKANKPYNVNAEERKWTPLFVATMDKVFAYRLDAVKPWLYHADVQMTILRAAGGSYDETNSAVEYMLRLLAAYYYPEGVLTRAPSYKPARLIEGRTMQFGQGLTQEKTMGATSLALNAQSQRKHWITHADGSVVYIDECSQLQGLLHHHAVSLRTTYASESKYVLDREIYGGIPILCYSQDYLNLPPVPVSSMLALVACTSDERDDIIEN